MRSRSRQLCESSISSALAAIEIYNKPNFVHREQVFSILMISAWETLFKARILNQNKNRLVSIYVKDGGHYKKNAAKTQYLTIGLTEAMGRCAVPAVVNENVQRLFEIRNAAIHFTAASKKLPQLTFMIGAASLKNYAKLIRDWFEVELSQYNFFILPLGFEYPFTSFSLADVAKEPKEVLALVNSISQAQDAGTDKDRDGFVLVCEFKASLVAAQKLKDRTDVVAAIDPTNATAVFVEKQVSHLSKYPNTYNQIVAALKQKDPTVKATQLNELIKTRNIKGDAKYSHYNFRSATDEAKGPNKATAVIYSDAFLALAKEMLCGRSKS